MTMTPADDAASILGPITPIRCTEPGCHWAAHGVPDKYANSRAQIVREHMAAEHTPTTEPAPAAAWVDGDPLMEALAAAVYEQCGTDPVGSIVVDDPRNIAAVAATVARQVLGTVTTPPETDPVGLCAACGAPREGHHHGYERTPGYDEAQQPETEPAPAVDRAAILREAADALDAYIDQYRSPSITNWSGAVTFLRRLADEAQQPTDSVTKEAVSDGRCPVVFEGGRCWQTEDHLGAHMYAPAVAEEAK